MASSHHHRRRRRMQEWHRRQRPQRRTAPQPGVGGGGCACRRDRWRGSRCVPRVTSDVCIISMSWVKQGDLHVWPQPQFWNCHNRYARPFAAFYTCWGWYIAIAVVNQAIWLAVL
jgi:hypothetical protein